MWRCFGKAQGEGEQMLDEPDTNSDSPVTTTRRRAAGRPAGPPKVSTDIFSAPAQPAVKPKNPPRAGGASAAKSEITKSEITKAEAPKAEKAEKTVKNAVESPATSGGDEKPKDPPAKKVAAKKAPVKKAATRAAGPAIAEALFQ